MTQEQKDLVRDWREEFDILINQELYSGIDEVFPRLRGFIEEFEQAVREDQKEKIKEKLMKVADAGEYEDLRREVLIYFNQLS